MKNNYDSPLGQEKQEIENWWAMNPQTYGDTHGQSFYSHPDGVKRVELGSKAFFDEADSGFINWNLPLEDRSGPFGRIFPYEKYRGKKVLEIGCGMGYMSSLWARRGASVTAVDLNATSIQQTKRRFELLGIKGEILKEDANHLPFADETFDYVYSWGVLHHSPNLGRSVSELARVLKSGGEYGVMLYSRSSILYWYYIQYLEGFLHGEGRFLDSLSLASRYTDGASEEGNPHTWPITKREAIKLFGPYSTDLSVKKLGTELDNTFRFMLPGLSLVLPRWAKKVWGRRFGWSLWIYGTRDARKR
jgi:2-polyprenyl-3-methyl-5-hydroxy-6-metoxy-1,4-benzoquinol methylase